MTAPTQDAVPGPLAGLRVVEMGSLIAGPFCGQLLGDLGAEVIKLEPPGKGDPMRQWGQAVDDARSYWWTVIARNKKSVTLDLRTPEGQALARTLIAGSDIVIENFRPGTVEGWGLGWDQLSALHPGLIMARVSGYGQDGPYAQRASYGSIGEAMGGLRYLTGYPDRPPTRVGLSIGDSLAGTFAALGCLAALRVRDATGRGQIVDSAIYEAVLAMTESLVPEYAGTGYQRERTGAFLPRIAPSNVYTASDGVDVLIAANQDTVFARLCDTMGQPDLVQDPRFCDHHARGAHQAEIDAIIADWAARQTSEALLARLDANGIPAGRIYRAADMLADPHFAARQALVEAIVPGAGTVMMQNVVPRLSMTPGAVRSAGPRLGEHTEPVLMPLIAEGAEGFEALRTKGII